MEVPESSAFLGELVIAKEDDHYELWSDRNVLFYSREKDNLAPLVSQDDFLLMEGIKMPLDRLKAFKGNKGNKLEFGKTIDVGSEVYIHLQEKRVRGVVHYKDIVGDLPGILFGVEIMVRFLITLSEDIIMHGHLFLMYNIVALLFGS